MSLTLVDGDPTNGKPLDTFFFFTVRGDRMVTLTLGSIPVQVDAICMIPIW